MKRKQHSTESPGAWHTPWAARKVRLYRITCSTGSFSALAKEFPDAYPDLCWAWAMNPAQTGRALSELLDAVPYNKIFSYGADTGWPWNNAGYSIQARTGIARVLKRKVGSGDFLETTAQEVASAIMLRNGEEFYGLS